MLAINTLAGRLGADPEKKLTKNNLPYCILSVAETRQVKKDSGWDRYCVWHRLKVWGPQAERAGKILRKGSLCIFQYRVDYQRETIRGKGGDYEMNVPSFTLTNFEPLADFGTRS